MNFFSLTPDQQAAADERRRDVAVTAGAGSGKTRTLVARYLPLLAETRDPRRIVAITFTEKAAREMRNRIRAEVRALADDAPDEATRQKWTELEAGLDGARISTIHSLCQEILRAHPVEAGVDPQFALIPEGQAAVLLAQAADAALVEVIEQVDFQPLFSLCKTGSLAALLQALVRRRLDLDETLAAGFDPLQSVRRALKHWLDSSEVQAAMADLAAWRADGTLAAAANAGDKLAPLALALLDDLASAQNALVGAQNALAGAQKALAGGETVAAALALFTARREHFGGRVGKNGPLKDTVKSLREAYDDALSWLGGAKSSDPAPDPAFEVGMAQATHLLLELYRRTRVRYLTELRRQGTLDFDDLESKALELLRRPEIAARWQAEISAVLVDEFQDTNPRQREIVRALCGSEPGHLFVVGDARQSIYRFRGADVTVFRSLQAEIRASGGLCLDLDRTFRTHAGLLSILDDLLGPLMGLNDRPDRPYHVPYTPLAAQRPEPREGCHAPHAAFVLASGDDSDTARPAAAHLLCQQLLELKRTGQIRAWDEVALLFRASTGFPAYEEALEAHGIPYVTVAGGGFYDRPEIRDLLNLLQALADPRDDLALTGLLCSPAFGLSPAGLARLRWEDPTRPHSQKIPLYTALMGIDADPKGFGKRLRFHQPLGSSDELSELDRKIAAFARSFLKELSPLVDRVPVAELLERVVAFTDYRAMLAGNSSRLWRNLDKLLADARASGTISVQAFLEYLRLLRGVGAREGEAPAEAEGAVRLMTIHKSKGLEFDFVVLADAARQGVNRSEPFYLLPETGLAFRPDSIDGEPLAYRLAKELEKRQSESESLRVLYVALTRAKEKLLISGHLTGKDGGVNARGWLKDLLQSAGVDLAALPGSGSHSSTLALPSGQILGVVYSLANVVPGEITPMRSFSQAVLAVDGRMPIYAPYLTAAAEPDPEDELDEPIDWRISANTAALVGRATGQIVHGCIRRWRFPRDAGYAALAGALAREQALFDAAQLDQALQQVETLLNRLRQHSLWGELNGASLRRHEVPYSLLLRSGRVETGYLDVLYRHAADSAGWEIVDFKTDTIQSEGELRLLTERYSGQLRRYRRAVERLLGPVERARICFLDDEGGVRLVEAGRE
jgi:ATP-dependent helicase/nuclease subunit A